MKVQEVLTTLKSTRQHTECGGKPGIYNVCKVLRGYDDIRV